jgi:hypothetical protein
MVQKDREASNEDCWVSPDQVFSQLLAIYPWEQFSRRKRQGSQIDSIGSPVQADAACQACQAPAKTGQPKVDDARIEPILGAVMALEEELSEG